MGLVPPCGDAEQNSIFARSESRLPSWLDDPLATAANGRSPPPRVGHAGSGGVILVEGPLPCPGEGAFAHAEKVRFPPFLRAPQPAQSGHSSRLPVLHCGFSEPVIHACRSIFER